MNAIVLFLYLPWLWIVTFDLIPNDKFNWLPQRTVLQALRELRSIHGFRHSWFTQPFSDILLFSLMGYGLFQARQRPATIVFGVLVVGVAPLLIWVTGLLEPVFMERTVFWGLIGSSLLLGIALSCMKRGIALAGLTFVVVVGLNSADNFHDEDAAVNRDWRGAVNYYLASESSRGRAPIIFCHVGIVPEFWYYARHAAQQPRMFGWGGKSAQLLVPIGVREAAESPWMETLYRTETVPLQLLRSNNPSAVERIWVFQANYCRSNEFATLGDALRDLGWTEQSTRRFKYITVRLFFPKDT